MDFEDPPIYVPSLAEEGARRDMARVVFALFDRWDLTLELQLSLLGMSSANRKILPLYRRGERALPNDRDTLDRAGYLLGIHKGLRLQFPEDEFLRYRWIKVGNRKLDGRTPLQIMVEEGLVGVARVARFVDFQRSQ